VKLSIKSQEDFWAGLMFIGFGLVAIIVARDYPMGSAMRMGPGYFPTYLGAILMFIGSIIVAISTRVQGEKVAGFAWRPLIMLCLAFIVYGLSMETFGLGFIPSIALVVIISAFAIREFRPLELVLLTATLVAMTTGLFIYGIDLPYPLWGGY
jgi:putative tricarboxylic transport membrane protein